MCSFDGCERKVFGHGLCQAHYKQARAGKELRPIDTRRGQTVGMTEYQRFMHWVQVADTGSCWLWLGSIRSTGGNVKYGQFTNAAKQNESAHRAAWRLMKGPIPAGMSVLHHCDNPLCCNPRHLFSGTQADNMADMWKKKRGLRGSRHGNSKLTEDIVRDIRSSKESGVELARRLGLTPTTICDIRKRRTWTHIV
jgi:hypothetical protein